MSLDPIIAPSILSADFARLGEECDAVIQANADWIHVDVMDNHYVPNLTMGPVVVKSLRDYGIQIPMDTHLMIAPVDDLIPAFAKAGSTYITFHPEATLHVDRTIQLIRDNGCKVGVAFNISSNLDTLKYILHKIDMVLLMSVNPGFGGQQFDPIVFDKVSEVRKQIDKTKLDIRLQVDGGVNSDNISKLVHHGADTFVMGSAVFGKKPYADTIQNIKSLLKKG